MPKVTFKAEYVFESDGVGNAHELALNYQAFLNGYAARHDPWLHHNAFPVYLESAVITAIDGDGQAHALTVPFTPSGVQPVPAATPEGLVSPVNVLPDAGHAEASAHHPFSEPLKLSGEEAHFPLVNDPVVKDE